MLYIFDKDGTIIASYGNRPANTIEEQHLLPGVGEKCAELRAQGHHLAVASNQGGVAFGFITNDQARALVAHAARLIGTKDYAYCPHHPKGTDPIHGIACGCRKPQPGMILQLILRNGIAASDTIVVGDRDTDRQAAEAAGAHFIHADKFFERS